jgi:nitrogen regulatory protein PII
MFMANTKQAKPVQAGGKMPALKMILLILDWDKAKAVSDVLGKGLCPLVFITKGSGTARSEVLDLLGVGATEKAVFVCVAEGSATPQLIKGVRHVMGSQSVGAGIAFTVPLSGINLPLMKVFLEMNTENVENEKPKENPKMANNNKMDAPASGAIQIKNDLIISILNHGFSDAFMSVARKAGAKGGTVLSARGLSQQIVKKFLGISVQDEKEIILILADKDTKVAIMQAVSAAHGIDSKAGGVVFSLPVDQVMSLNEIQ